MCVLRKSNFQDCLQGIRGDLTDPACSVLVPGFHGHGDHALGQFLTSGFIFVLTVLTMQGSFEDETSWWVASA